MAKFSWIHSRITYKAQQRGRYEASTLIDTQFNEDARNLPAQGHPLVNGTGPPKKADVRRGIASRWSGVVNLSSFAGRTKLWLCFEKGIQAFFSIMPVDIFFPFQKFVCREF
jgi:hypothetical protein